MLRTSVGIGLLVMVAMGPPALGQTVRYVDDDAPAGGDGLSWTTAYADLQTALSEATADAEIEEIHVAGGMYHPSALTDPNEPRSATFMMVPDVAIRGGYAGLEDLTDPNARDWDAYESKLSGTIYVEGEYTGNVLHVVTASGVGQSAMLDGFTITRGYAVMGNRGGYWCGGGMRVGPTAGTHAVVANCTFEDNTAQAAGALYCGESCRATLTACVFKWNQALVAAGAIGNSGTAITLTDCVFRENHAYGGSGGAIRNSGDTHATITGCEFIENEAIGWAVGGGAICNEGNTFTFTDCLFADNYSDIGGAIWNWRSYDGLISGCVFGSNSASAWGGAIGEDESETEIVDCEFILNSVDYGPGGAIANWKSDMLVRDCSLTSNYAVYEAGGAIHNWAASPAIVDCVFDNNRTIGGGCPPSAVGAAMYNGDGSSPTVTRCTFTENSSDSSGGAVGNEVDSNPVFVDCWFLGNTAELDGGAMASVDGCHVRMINCVVAGNSAEERGGGLYFEWRCDPTITNCTFWDNSASAGAAISSMDYSIAFLTNCILSGPTFALPIIDEGYAMTFAEYCCVMGGYEGAGNIDLLPLLADPNNGDYNLTPESPCIDIGGNDADTNWITPDIDELPDTDILGRPRFYGWTEGHDPNYVAVNPVDMGAHEYLVCNGDIDLDGIVGLRDLQLLLSSYGDDEVVYTDGDINGDRKVDLADLQILLAYYGLGR